MRIIVNTKRGEIDLRCWLRLHAYTRWMYNGQPPMHRACKRCGEIQYHHESREAWWTDREERISQP